MFSSSKLKIRRSFGGDLGMRVLGTPRASAMRHRRDHLFALDALADGGSTSPFTLPTNEAAQDA